MLWNSFFSLIYIFMNFLKKLFIGSRNFHPPSLVLSTNKPKQLINWSNFKLSYFQFPNHFPKTFLSLYRIQYKAVSIWRGRHPKLTLKQHVGYKVIPTQHMLLAASLTSIQGFSRADQTQRRRCTKLSRYSLLSRVSLLVMVVACGSTEGRLRGPTIRCLSRRTGTEATLSGLLNWWATQFHQRLGFSR